MYKPVLPEEVEVSSDGVAHEGLKVLVGGVGAPHRDGGHFLSGDTDDLARPDAMKEKALVSLCFITRLCVWFSGLWRFRNCDFCLLLSLSSQLSLLCADSFSSNHDAIFGIRR